MRRLQQSVRARRWRAGEWREINEAAAREVCLHIRHPGGESRLWACPRECAELVAGHVLLECLHDAAPDSPSPHGLPSVEVREENGVWHVSPPSPHPVLRTGADARFPSPTILLARMADFLRFPGLGDDTGCCHRAALFHATTGHFAHVTEDISRHNCLDRLAGHIALRGDKVRIRPENHILLVSARITASLYCKARRLGVRCIVSRAAVSSAAVDMAQRQSVALIGFCRPEEERFTVFNSPQDGPS